MRRVSRWKDVVVSLVVLRWGCGQCILYEPRTLPRLTRRKVEGSIGGTVYVAYLKAGVGVAEQYPGSHEVYQSTTLRRVLAVEVSAAGYCSTSAWQGVAA